jgi:hypothetical protein
MKERLAWLVGAIALGAAAGAVAAVGIANAQTSERVSNCAGTGAVARQIAESRDEGVPESAMLRAIEEMTDVSDADRATAVKMVAIIYGSSVTPRQAEAAVIEGCLNGGGGQP